MHIVDERSAESGEMVSGCRPLTQIPSKT